MNLNIKNIILGTAIVLPATMGLSISNADTIQNLKVNSSVNFRVAPNNNSTKIDKLQKGQTVQYLGTSGNWYKIKYNNQTGYIYKTYASIVSTAESSNNLIKSVNCSSLNLRSGAGTNYSIIKVLYKGTNVEILSTTDNNWSKISVNGTIGYVSSTYLSPVNTTSKDTQNNTTNETVKYYRYTTTKLNFRQDNNTKSTVICKLAKNTKVGVISTTSNGWAKIKYNGTYGYVNTSYLTSKNNADSNKSSTKSEKIAKIVKIAKSKIGCSYVRGSEGPNTFDCSGLTSYLYKQIGISIPRGSSSQQYFGKAVSKSNLQPGDLVFLDTRGKGSVDHASIYIGNGTIIHANSTAGKVGTSNLNSSYYKKAYVSARRILD